MTKSKARQKAEAKTKKASEAAAAKKDALQQALDGIAERVQLLKVLLREILVIADEQGIEVKGIVEDLTEEERARLNIPKELTEAEETAIANYWDASGMAC